MRDVYCLIKEDSNIYWAEKDDSDPDYIPRRIYNVDKDRVMTLEEKEDCTFFRWCSAFDL